MTTRKNPSSRFWHYYDHAVVTCCDGFTLAVCVALVGCIVVLARRCHEVNAKYEQALERGPGRKSPAVVSYFTNKALTNHAFTGSGFAPPPLGGLSYGEDWTVKFSYVGKSWLRVGTLSTNRGLRGFYHPTNTAVTSAYEPVVHKTGSNWTVKFK